MGVCVVQFTTVIRRMPPDLYGHHPSTHPPGHLTTRGRRANSATHRSSHHHVTDDGSPHYQYTHDGIPHKESNECTHKESNECTNECTNKTRRSGILLSCTRRQEWV